MAAPRIARLISARHAGTDTRVLEFAMEGEYLNFTGGQYIIVHTGIPIGGDKTAKRAYSFLSSDLEQNRFEIAVRRIGEGPGSNFMHGLSVGEELTFSGPWGKFITDEQAANPTQRGSVLILATDTGITAALGLVNSVKSLPHESITDVFWFMESDEYFLSEEFVRSRFLHRCRNFRVMRIPSVDVTQRHSWFEAHHKSIFEGILAEGAPQSSFLCGDGFLVARFRQALLDWGIADSTVHVETFFNHAERKATSKTVVP
jgi:ferredoxin-NADP reductase